MVKKKLRPSKEEKKAFIAKREEQTREQYATIGEFIVEFGQLFFWHRIALISMLSHRILINQNIGQIILGNRVITPEPLLRITESLIGELFGEDDLGITIFNHIKGRYGKLIEIRNDIAHGVMFVGWGNEETVDYSEFSAFKVSPNKDGYKQKNLPKTAEEILSHIDEIKEVSKLLHRFFGCISLKLVEPKMGEFSRNFSQNEDGNWVPHLPKPEEGN